MVGAISRIGLSGPNKVNQMLARSSKKLIATLAFATLAAFAAQSASAAQTGAALTHFNNGNTATNAPDQWKVLANGCSYSRTQAPGYAPQWILIQNPHHVGGKYVTKSMGCALLIQG